LAYRILNQSIFVQQKCHLDYHHCLDNPAFVQHYLGKCLVLFDQFQQQSFLLMQTIYPSFLLLVIVASLDQQLVIQDLHHQPGQMIVWQRHLMCHLHCKLVLLQNQKMFHYQLHPQL
jgi:hypothetical protein